MLEHACRLGLEGIVSKRKDLPYRAGRGDHWLKAKCVLRQEFVILGYVPSTAAKAAVGSLLLGYHDDGKLLYAGRVGTGYSAEQATSAAQRARQRSTPRSRSFANALPDRRREGRALGQAAARRARSSSATGAPTG